MSTVADSSPSEQGYSPPTYAIVLVVLVFVIGLSAVIGYRYSHDQHIQDVVQSRFPIFTTQQRGLGLQAIQRIPIVRYRKQASPADEEPSETQHPSSTLSHNTANFLPDRWQIASTRANHRLISIDAKSRKTSLGDGQPSCCICTEEIVEGAKIRRLPCGHIFHPQCIDPWLIDQASTCPLWYAAVNSRKMNLLLTCGNKPSGPGGTACGRRLGHSNEGEVFYKVICWESTIHSRPARCCCVAPRTRILY